MRQSIAVALVVLGLVGCAGPSITASPTATTITTPVPTVAAKLSLTATGLVRCGIIPDWGCAYFIEIQGADGIVHEGWFDYPVIESPSPATGVVGDIPTDLAPGTYLVTFLKQRVSDLVSFEPVPGGTPRMTNRGDVFAKCETTVEVSGTADIAVDVAFSDAACIASAVATPRR